MNVNDRSGEGRGVYLVIPAYNEGPRILPVLESLGARFGQVVVVDDGSTDDTYPRLLRQPGIVVLRHLLNRGQGAALQTGITYSLSAGAEYIVTFDADGQHQPHDIPQILEPLLQGEADVVLGSRFLRDDSNVPALRRIVLQAGRWFTWAMSGLLLSDCHNGFRGFSRAAAAKLEIRQDRMAHASELYDQIHRNRFRVREVPVSIRYTAETLAKGQSLSNSLNVLVQYLLGKVSK